jgi:hypothetical protein
MAVNDFLPFATGGGALVQSQAAWVENPNVAQGFGAGIADELQCNKAWRQGAFMAAALGQFITTTTAQNCLDDGDLDAKVAQIIAAVAVAAVPPTGDVKWRPTQEVLAGYVMANATTIGNGASGASQRANADTAALYTWFWTNFSNSQCPVIGGRGVSAAADFTASKAITVLDMKGIIALGMDTMGGTASTRLSGVPVTSGSATTPGSVLGENLHTLLLAELAQHNHGIADSGHHHAAPTGKISTGGSGSPINSYNDSGFNVDTGNATTGITINNTGSNTPHNNTQLGMTGTWYIKL